MLEISPESYGYASSLFFLLHILNSFPAVILTLTLLIHLPELFEPQLHLQFICVLRRSISAYMSQT